MGTTHSSTDTNQSTRPSPGRARLIALGIFLLAAGSLVIALERAAWQRIARLHSELDAIQTESLHLGVHVRAGIWRLNARLLRFELSGNETERQAFHSEARELAERLAASQSHLSAGPELELISRTATAFNAYLHAATPLLEEEIRGIRRDTTAQLQGEIDTLSAELLRLCDELVHAQRASLSRLIDDSEAALQSLTPLLQLSLAVLLVLLLALAFLLHRILVTPLRLKLDQSHALIERQEKLASLGTLATGVAHEIRNPLTAIKFRLFSFQNSLPPGTADLEDLRVIGDELNRLERIVKDFLQFARPSSPHFERITAGSILEEVDTLLRAQLERRRIQLYTESPDDLWLHADREQIKQVLINLVQNSAESIASNGAITLSARGGVARLEGRTTPVTTLEVTDNGRGIPAGSEARIFDPFFSTKEGGTGLGLSIAARIIEKHGGHLQYQSRQDQGTTFTLVLPKPADHASHNPDHRG